MALEDLNPTVRVESILNGDEITPATRLEYFLQKAATEVPKPAAGDAGKVLTVNEDADGVEWEEAGSGLPEVTSSDEGKVLAVNASGEWAAENKSGLCVETEGTLNKSYNDIVAMVTNGIYPFIFKGGYVYFIDSIFIDDVYCAGFRCIGNDSSIVYYNESASGLLILD